MGVYAWCQRIPGWAKGPWFRSWTSGTLVRGDCDLSLDVFSGVACSASRRSSGIRGLGYHEYNKTDSMDTLLMMGPRLC